MPANKDRLYVALYARSGTPKMPGRDDTYHWALIIGPKRENKDSLGTKYHAKNAIGQSEWFFEEKQTQLAAVDMILVRILIAKVTDSESVERILRAAPVVQNDTAWNCVAWVKHAIALLADDKKVLGTSCVDWDKIRDTAMVYCQKKRDEHRFDGKGAYDIAKVPTFDLLGGCETTV